MKGRFNLNMTEYYIEGKDIREFEYVQTIYDPWLEKHGFQFKQYYAVPTKKKFAFMVTYETPAQFQADAFLRNLTNYKI